MLRDISIIIRTKNEGPSLKKLLKKIVAQDTNFNYEIVLVDSNSTDCTRKIAKEYGCKIVNIPTKMFTWGNGLNQGIKESKGEFCILLSAHAYPVDNLWMTKLVSPLIKNENVAASYGGQIPIKGLDIFEEVELKLWFPKEKRMAISNANACIRRSVWNIFKFNEKLRSCEDLEWALRVQNAGFFLKYVPEAAVYHSHPMRLKNIYNRWYWRAHELVYILRNERRIHITIKLKLFKIVGTIFSFLRYFSWVYYDIIHCLNEHYFKEIYKAPFYEFIRTYAYYKGLMDGVKDMNKRHLTDNNLFFSQEPNMPSFLEKFTFLKN